VQLPFTGPGLAGPKVGVTATRPCRLRLFADLRRSQAETAAVDFVRNDALVERFSNSLIQALQKCPPGAGEQRCDMRPAILRVGR
jgi:hypothetical protein